MCVCTSASSWWGTAEWPVTITNVVAAAGRMTAGLWKPVLGQLMESQTLGGC